MLLDVYVICSQDHSRVLGSNEMDLHTIKTTLFFFVSSQWLRKCSLTVEFNFSNYGNVITCTKFRFCFIKFVVNITIL